MARSEAAYEPSRKFSWRRWEMFAAPRGLVSVLLLVDVVAMAGVIAAVVPISSSFVQLTEAAVLVFLCGAYEEVSRRVEGLRYRFGAGVHTDMSSVWIVAAGMALSPGYAILVAVGVRAWIYYLYVSRGPAKPYRQVFTSATMVLGCLAIGVVLRGLGLSPGRIPSSLTAALSVLLAISVFIVVNRCLVIGAVCIAEGKASVSRFVQNWEDNALEIATLALGGIGGLLLLTFPWLIILVVAPMYLLQRSALVKQFREAAMSDPKTGLLNAVAWQELAKRELARAQRDRASAGLLIIDLDHFKLVNDVYGHLAGDAALRALAACLGRELRDYDAIGRFGGEEFVALLPATSPEEAMHTAERLRAAVAALRVGDAAFGLTTSIGVACYPRHGEELEDLLHKADLAMYEAKRAGRNQVALSRVDVS